MMPNPGSEEQLRGWYRTVGKFAGREILTCSTVVYVCLPAVSLFLYQHFQC